jgi:hypothetical protein
MSVYCSFGVFDEDGTRDSAWGFPQPYGYRKSHILPTADDPRAGSFDLGLIPGFIRRDGDREDLEDEDAAWPYLRVSLTGSDEEPDTIVLDVDQVTSLVEVLNDWLNRVNRDLK